jgi:hypothetical protein
MSTEIEIKTEKYVCRICLEEDIIDNLLHPCRCAGHSKYVHSSCLNKWRATSESHNKTCPTCRTEYKKVGEKVKYSFIIDKHRDQSSKITLFAFLIIMLYSTIGYAIDIDKSFAHNVGIYDKNFLQQFRIYFILHLGIWAFFIFNSFVYEMYQLNRNMIVKYILSPSNKIYLLYYLTIALYYSLGFEYTNFVSDFFGSAIVFESFIKSHITKIETVNNILDTVVDFDS